MSRCAEHGEVVVSDQAERAALGHQLGALVGLGAVADHVAQAPDLSTGAVDAGEHRLEGGQVGVDVADQAETHLEAPRNGQVGGRSATSTADYRKRG